MVNSCPTLQKPPKGKKIPDFTLSTNSSVILCPHIFMCFFCSLLCSKSKTDEIISGFILEAGAWGFSFNYGMWLILSLSHSFLGHVMLPLSRAWHAHLVQMGACRIMWVSRGVASLFIFSPTTCWLSEIKKIFMKNSWRKTLCVTHESLLWSYNLSITWSNLSFTCLNFCLLIRLELKCSNFTFHLMLRVLLFTWFLVDD